MADIKRYYYCEDGETAVGPFSREKFQELLAKEVVPWEVWVTREDTMDWLTAAEYDEFRDFDALVASGRAGENYQSVLDAAFTSTLEDEQRAQELQTLQRATARIDLARYRESAGDIEEVPTGEKPSNLWFLRYFRIQYIVIALGFILALGLVFMISHNAGKPGKKTEQALEQPSTASTGTAPLAGGGPIGQPRPNPKGNDDTEVEDAIRAEEEARLQATNSSQEGLSDSRVSVRESPARPADFYLLSRAYTVNVDNEAISLAEGQKVRVIERQPDVWMVEADGVRFQVAPTDLRRENSDAVSTVGTTMGGSTPRPEIVSEGVYESPSNARPSGRGVPAPALP